jgi:hypothetical protein
VALTGILLGVFLSAHCAAVRSPNRQARTVGQQFYELTPIEILNSRLLRVSISFIC